MKNEFESEETFEKFYEFQIPKDTEIHDGGQQNIFRFKNNFGASVVSHKYSYGEMKFWELAVAKFHSEDNDDWSINYDTEITGDVLGWLSVPEVLEILQKIQSL